MARNETVLLGLNQLIDWGILTTDAKLNVTGWNHWLETNSGLAASEVVGRNLPEVFPELVARRLDQFYRQALEGRVIVLAQRFHDYLLPMTSANATDDAHMRQSVRIGPLVEDEVVVGTLTVIEDVTERVAYDAELAARARQQAAVAALGQRALAGGELAELLNEASAVVAETVGVKFCAILELVPGDQTMLLRAGVGWEGGRSGRATVDAGPGSYADHVLGVAGPVVINDLNAEARFPAPALFKEHGVISGLSVPLIVGGKQFLGVVGVYAGHRRAFTDDHIHFLQAAANVLGMAIERKNLEGELQARVDQLAETDRRKDEFLAMLAHELRNPLAPIRNAMSLIRKRGEERRQGVLQAYDIIERQVETLVRLVDDLLDVSRITRGKIHLQTQPVDLAHVVARAVEGSRPLIDARRHTLEVKLPEVPVPVDADPLRLAQVLWNLLNNAAKYTPEEGRIVLTVGREVIAGGGNEAVVRVRDTGTGILPEMLPKVFDLFTQMDRTLDRAEGGLGIGLTLVRRLTEMHGGTVQALSEGLGRGSEFVVRLPALPAEGFADRPEQLAPGPERPAATAGRRILVVDDNQDSAESLAMLLRLFGNDVRTVYDGRLALEVAAAHRAEVVLLDIGLPGMDGLEVCRQLRGRVGSQPLIVAMTGYGQEEDRRRSQEVGFNAHLVKPVDMEALQELLARPELRGNPNGESLRSSP